MAVDGGLVQARRVAARRLLRAAGALDLGKPAGVNRVSRTLSSYARTKKKPAATSTTAAATTGHHVRGA